MPLFNWPDMRWVDVAGAPGSGKSSLCDHLWPPHCIATAAQTWPEEWLEFWRVTVGLLDELQDHETFYLLKGMTSRSFNKMLNVSLIQSDAVYIQTGFAQRGLGFGWRLEQRGKTEMVRDYFRLMPVSLGVVAIKCPEEIAVERNRLRPIENRDFMVPLMRRSREILIEEMDARGVPVREIDTTGPIAEARAELVEFAGGLAAQPKAFGLGGEMAAVS